MKTMHSPLRPTQVQSLQVVKCALTLSMILALSACGSIRYNGFSNADTIADLFSFTEPEASESSVKTEATAQTVSATKPQGEENVAETANEPTLAKASQADSASEEMMTGEQKHSAQNAVSEQAVATEIAVKSEVAATDIDSTSEALKTASRTDTQVQEAEPVQTEQTQTPDPIQQIAKTSEAPQVTESSQLDTAAVEEVNRLTQENPTAAISSDYQVLPEVQSEVAEISVPNEILLLATPAEYRPEVSEYGMWEIAQGEDSLYRENCTLASATMQVSFDNYSTQVWLKVVGDDLLVNSTTNIDIHKPRVGIKLDNGALQPFSKKHFNTSAVWSGNLKRALQSNKSLSVALSGNELGGRIQELTVELDDLKRAYSEYSKCNATTQIGSL